MLNDIKENIIERLKTLPIKIKAAAIYGSMAKRTQNKDSDVDLLIIAENLKAKKHKRGKDIVAIKEVLALGYPLDILLLTTKECLSNFRNHNPFFFGYCMGRNNFIG